jgi:DNA-binding XRE family transcriptional regulator
MRLVPLFAPARFNGKGRHPEYFTHMNHLAQGNYLRTHRKRSGLSQRELGMFLGYRNQWQVSRHERSQTTPPLPTALAYEVIFHVPVSTLFAGVRVNTARSVEAKIAAFERSLERSHGKGRTARTTAQKLEWLTQRRTS